MEMNDNNQPWTSRSILSAFTSATEVGEMGKAYVLNRHHHIEKPKHALDYTRVYFNGDKRDDGHAMAIMA